jgi:hypothetical protein
METCEIIWNEFIEHKIIKKFKTLTNAFIVFSFFEGLEMTSKMAY